MLLNRLAMLGPGARMAAKRREWTRRQEELMQAERQVQWAANVNGRGAPGRGQFRRP